MSPKSPGKTAAPKKDGVKKDAKKESAASPSLPEESNEELKAMDPDELEEQEEAEEVAANSSSNQGGNAAALAAASGSSSEMSASFKNFRHHPDMENFYRFIYENDLRHEALAIIDDIIANKAEKRLNKSGKH